jgi:hypothetical protein
MKFVPIAIADGKQKCLPRVAIAVVAAFALATTAWAEDWPSFRGPRGTGVSEDTAAPLASQSPMARPT